MRRLSIFDGKGKNWGRTEFRWVDFSPRVQGFFSCTAAFAANRPCVPLRMPTRPSFFRHRPRLPSAFAANQPCTLFRVPTRPSFPVPGRVPRPHLRQTSPARCFVCRRVWGIDSFADKQCHVCTWSEVGGRFAANAAMGRWLIAWGGCEVAVRRQEVEGGERPGLGNEPIPEEPGGDASREFQQRIPEENSSRGRRERGPEAGSRRWGKGAVSGFLRRCRDFLLF